MLHMDTYYFLFLSNTLSFSECIDISACVSSKYYDSSTTKTNVTQTQSDHDHIII